MATNGKTQGPESINPLFYIPEGLIDYQYSGSPGASGTEYGPDDLPEDYLVGDYGLESEDSLFDEGDDEGPDDVETPNNITIVDQVIRTLPSGMQVVDLIVDVEDIAGAVNYEFRVVKN